MSKRNIVADITSGRSRWSVDYGDHSPRREFETRYEEISVVSIRPSIVSSNVQGLFRCVVEKSLVMTTPADTVLPGLVYLR